MPVPYPGRLCGLYEESKCGVGVHRAKMDVANMAEGSPRRRDSHCYSSMSMSSILSSNCFGADSSWPEKRPNIGFILIDQDLHIDSLDHIPVLQQYNINDRAFSKRHYCSITICLYGPRKLVTETFYTGKLFNAHSAVS